MEFPYSEIEGKLGYAFRNRALLKEAFTHSSYKNKNGGKDNERLEYLGDSVLQLVVTEWQYARDGRASEGALTKERQKLVCADALDSAVDGLELGKYLLVSGGKANVGKKTTSSIFEAVTAAIYLDGGYEPAKRFVLEHGNLEFGRETENSKGALQEYLQKRGEQPPAYSVEKTGKDNAPFFRCTAMALGESARGEGRTKREAEATAASRLLWELTRADQKKK